MLTFRQAQSMGKSWVFLRISFVLGGACRSLECTDMVDFHPTTLFTCFFGLPAPLLFGSYIKSGKIWEQLRIWGLGESGGHFHCNFREKTGPKAPYKCLLHFGRVTFRFPFGKNREPFIFLAFGLGGRVHHSQNQLFWTLTTPKYSKWFKESRIIFEKCRFLKTQNIGHWTFWNLRKDACRTSRRSV